MKNGQIINPTVSFDNSKDVSYRTVDIFVLRKIG